MRYLSIYALERYGSDSLSVAPSPGKKASCFFEEMFCENLLTIMATRRRRISFVVFLSFFLVTLLQQQHLNT